MKEGEQHKEGNELVEGLGREVGKEETDTVSCTDGEEPPTPATAPLLIA